MLPTLREVIEGALGFQLPPLPAPPLTVKNLDKVCAALLDVPRAHVEGYAASIGRPEQGEKVSSVFVDAIRRQLGGASNEKIASVVDGLVADYIEKRNRRTRVLEIAAQENHAEPPSGDTDAVRRSARMLRFRGALAVLPHRRHCAENTPLGSTRPALRLGAATIPIT